MGFCRKVKWTVNMARTGSSFLVLFCCFSRVAPQAPSSGKQKERKGSLGEHDRSPSPVPVCDAQRNLHPSPEGKGLKLLLPFPRGEGAGLVALPPPCCGDTTGAQAHVGRPRSQLQRVPPHPSLAQHPQHGHRENARRHEGLRDILPVGKVFQVFRYK